ncbi:MAG: CrcB family protein [Candidatus Atribacteria bacterium]|nr:CrcB family protein [Candidatus Atribacteria bacterium]
MRDVLLVGFGGAIGALLRFIIGGIIQKNTLTFPLSTFVINVVGSFFLSLLMYSAEYGGLVSREIRIFFAVGVLGAFTTFSSLEYESLRLLEVGEYFLFLLDLLGNVIFGFGACLSGKIVATIIWR